MTDSGPGIKEGGRATQPFDSTSSSKRTAPGRSAGATVSLGMVLRGFIVFGLSRATVLVAFFLECDSGPALAQHLRFA